MHLYKLLKKPKTENSLLIEKLVVASDYFSVEKKFPNWDKIRLVKKDIEILKAEQHVP